MTYTTFETKADLDSYDLSTITDGINIMLVKQDEGYPRPEVGDTACYSTIYLVIPKNDPTQNTAEFVAKLNMSEELIKKQLEEALNKALYVYTVDHYEVCLSSDDGALLIVADTATPNDGEIKLSDVTPVQPDGVVVNVGDYVKFVPSVKTDVTKFVGRNEIDVDTVGKLSTIEEAQDDGSKKEFLAFNGSKIETELQLDDAPTKDSDKFVNSGAVYGSLFTTKQRTVIDTPENYVACQSTDTDALEIVDDSAIPTATQVKLSTVQAFVPTASIGEYYQHIAEVSHLEDYEDTVYRLKDESYSKEEVDAKILQSQTGVEMMTIGEFNDYFDGLVVTASSIQTP